MFPTSLGGEANRDAKEFEPSGKHCFRAQTRQADLIDRDSGGDFEPEEALHHGLVQAP